MKPVYKQWKNKQTNKQNSSSRICNTGCHSSHLLLLEKGDHMVNSW